MTSPTLPVPAMYFSILTWIFLVAPPPAAFFLPNRDVLVDIGTGEWLAEWDRALTHGAAVWDRSTPEAVEAGTKQAAGPRAFVAATKEIRTIDKERFIVVVDGNVKCNGTTAGWDGSLCGVNNQQPATIVGSSRSQPELQVMRWSARRSSVRPSRTGGLRSLV